MKKTGFLWESGPNLMSFAFNRGGWVWKKIFLGGVVAVQQLPLPEKKFGLRGQKFDFRAFYSPLKSILADSLFFKIFFFLLIWADGALKWAKSEENDIYWGGCDAYLEIYLADIFPRKKARSQTIWGILYAWLIVCLTSNFAWQLPLYCIIAVTNLSQEAQCVILLCSIIIHTCWQSWMS